MLPTLPRDRCGNDHVIRSRVKKASSQSILSPSWVLRSPTTTRYNPGYARPDRQHFDRWLRHSEAQVHRWGLAELVEFWPTPAPASRSPGRPNSHPAPANGLRTPPEHRHKKLPHRLDHSDSGRHFSGAKKVMGGLGIVMQRWGIAGRGACGV